jgi:transcriptional regulator with XRE-family HTH domain
MEQSELRALLKRAGVKHADLATELGIDPSTLSLKLSGKRPFRVEEVTAIRDLLNRPENFRRLRRRRPLTLEDVLSEQGAA